MSTPVAFGCHLSSIVDHNHFLVLLSLAPSSDRIAIVGARSKYLIRGNNDKNVLMKNCAILRVRIDGEIATVKVFKQYFHFCKTSLKGASEIASFLCAEMVKAQRLLADDVMLDKRLDELIAENNHIPPEAREESRAYFKQMNICALDLTHDEVNATMTNHSFFVGSKIHTSRLARLLQEENETNQWLITYDNALSLSIRILVPHYDTDKKGHVFTVQPTGNIFYSFNDDDESLEEAKESVEDFVRSKLPLIALTE